MHVNYTHLPESIRTLAFICEYGESFENYMRDTARKWAGDPLKTLDPYNPEKFDYWKECDGMRKVCDATSTEYGDFWRSAFDLIFSFDHPFPTPPLFFNKRGSGDPNVEFMLRIIKGIEKERVVVSSSPYYKPENYVGSVQQLEYFRGLKEQLAELGREDVWERLVQQDRVPVELA